MTILQPSLHTDNPLRDETETECDMTTAIASKEEMTELVAEAYARLYDLVFLRSHPLAQALTPTASASPKERAWQLQKLLLETVEELNPGPQAPISSLETRRYQLVSLFHVEGLDPQAVADRLGISRRHFYREYSAAMGDIAAMLWDRYAAAPPVRPHQAQEARPDHLQILRFEAARLAQSGRYARLPAVLAGVSGLLQDRLRVQGIAVVQDTAEDLPPINLEPNVLRQILLTLVSYLVERTQQATLHIEAEKLGRGVEVTLAIDPARALTMSWEHAVHECVRTVHDLSGLDETALQLLKSNSHAAGFVLLLPAVYRRTVLVVDDNPDVVELFVRYLTLHGYDVATAHSGHEALALAREARPYAITLDVMMPEQDGWDVLQTLTNDPSTQSIPVVVCSVLRARELALSLGAVGFVEKPVTEESLLAALRTLDSEMT